MSCILWLGICSDKNHPLACGIIKFRLKNFRKDFLVLWKPDWKDIVNNNRKIFPSGMGNTVNLSTVHEIWMKQFVKIRLPFVGQALLLWISWTTTWKSSHWRRNDRTCGQRLSGKLITSISQLMIAEKHWYRNRRGHSHCWNSSPVGPCTYSLLHPFIGMVYDPMEFIPFIGATVMVNGMPRAQAGSEGKCSSRYPMGEAIYETSHRQRMRSIHGKFQCEWKVVCQTGNACIVMSVRWYTLTSEKKIQVPGMKLPVSVLLTIPAGMPGTLLVGLDDFFHQWQ